MILWLLREVLVVRKRTYQAGDDGFAISPVILGCLLLAALLHADLNSSPLFDTYWMAGLFISVVAVLPQLWLIAKTGGRCEALPGHYIATMAMSRMLSGIVMWDARGQIRYDPWVEGWNHA